MAINRKNPALTGTAAPYSTVKKALYIDGALIAESEQIRWQMGVYPESRSRFG